MKILHIYSGSQASGGLYLKEIVDTLNTHSIIKQETIVSYYYPFESTSKIFFRYTDLASNIKKSKFRLILRYFELIIGLVYSTFFCLFFKPDILNYSLNSSYKVEYYFLKIIRKLSSTKIYITCHDVIPFKSGLISAENDFKRRKLFFDLADKLIVHNKKNITDLVEHFHQNKENILFHPFPIMDMSKLNILPKNFEVKEKFDFCFLGHLREEKGIDLLLNAWSIFIKQYPSAKLVIAGNKANANFKLNKKELNQLNITLFEKYLPDKLYYNLILNSNCIILPYLKGTNSGVLSTIVSTNIEIIASDIDLFKNNPLIERSSLFEAGDVNGVVNKLEMVYNKSNQDRVRIKLIRDYKLKFKEKLIQTYITN